ncbi:hypothetical protein SUGI_0764780 [Cryptomeria japonica]|nr:hypothetical protein SUGI_0764780 [Cryptomeria japonica]
MISCNITCLQHERDALLSFMNKLNSAFLLHSWQGFNCCEWRGVECSSHTSNVVKLHYSSDLWSDERNSTLLTDLFQLKRLQHLDLSFNSLSGVLPKGLFALQELRHLDLSWNYFEGEIPKQFASLHNLAYLNLSMAGFNGTIPYQLGNLSQLEFLDLSVAEVYDFGTEVRKAIGSIPFSSLQSPTTPPFRMHAFRTHSQCYPKSLIPHPPPLGLQ